MLQEPNKYVKELTQEKYKYGFTTDVHTDIIEKGLNEDVVRLISAKKGEPEWLLEFRLKAYRYWLTMEMPTWAHLNIPEIDYQAISYYADPTKKKEGPKSLDEVDPELLKTFNKLGIPLEEQMALSGMAVDAVMDSVSVKTTFKETLMEKGIIFCSMSEAVREHPDLVKKYLGSVVGYRDNFFAALNSAVFSDGSFVYIPKGVRCPMELSTYFRINAANTGQFERTLIVADDDSYVSYLEGCTAPMRDENQLHAAIVEIVVLDRAEVKYSTVQNWYPGDAEGKGGVYNFVTKRGNPKPVLVISSLTFEGAEATLKALELGALDYMPKYVEGTTVFAIAQKELTEKVKFLAKKNATMRFLTAKLRSKPAPKTTGTSSTLTKSAFSGSAGTASATSSLSSATSRLSALSKPSTPVQTTPMPSQTPMPTGKPRRDIVAIGVSTGGPPAVQKVLSALPENFPACILIAQHMPAAFTGAFAKRLDSLCKIKVKEAKDGDSLISGVAYVCPGGQHISVTVRGAMPHIKISPEPTTELYKPSASILNESVAIMGNKVVGLTMTGMGSDGCEGTKVLRAKGGYILAQSEESCVVYGMPRAVVEAKLAHEIVDLDDIAEALIRALYK